MAWKRERKCRMFEGAMKERCLDLGGKHVDLSSVSTADSPPSDVSAISAWFANSAIPWPSSGARTEFWNRFQLHSSDKVPIEKENKSWFLSFIVSQCFFFPSHSSPFQRIWGLKKNLFSRHFGVNFCLNRKVAMFHRLVSILCYLPLLTQTKGTFYFLSNGINCRANRCLDLSWLWGILIGRFQVLPVV